MLTLKELLTFELFQLSCRKINIKWYDNAKLAFTILSYPSTIYSMIQTIEMGFSPLNAVCKTLESHLDCSDMQVRQIIGLEISYILSLFGYKPIKDSRSRLREVCKGKYFVSGSLYEQVSKSKYTFHITIGEI